MTFGNTERLPVTPAAKLATSPALAVAAIAPAVVLAIGMVAAVNLAIPKLQARGLPPSRQRG